MPASILQRLEPRYDSIVAAIYRAGSGKGDWLEPISEIAQVFDAWSVQLLGVDKQTGVMTFSYEAGSAPPAAPVEYLRYYHRIDPRLGKHMPSPAGQWMSCEEHFDEAFAASDPFYRDYLIPMGARYLYGVKLHDDARASVLLGHLSRVESGRPLASEEKEAFAKLSEHMRKALDITRVLAASEGRNSVALQLLEKMPQPILLLDPQRRITYRNAVGGELLARERLVRDAGGFLQCTDPDVDLALTIAMRDLMLVRASTHGDQAEPSERRTVRLVDRHGRQAAATLLALRPGATLGSFGRASQALFTVFEPGAAVEIDSFAVSTTFGLTPAEARLAVLIVNGRTPEQCAADLGTRVSTVRSQLASTYGKTGTSGQVELIRLILSAGQV